MPYAAGKPLDLRQAHPAHVLAPRSASCHSTIRSSASARSHAGRQPRLALGLARVQRQVARLGRVLALVELPARAPRPTAPRGARRSSATVRASPVARSEVPGLAPPPASATAPRPAAGTRSAGSARAARGAPPRDCAACSGSPAWTARTMSASSLSSPQSPPPITLPARAVAIRIEPRLPGAGRSAANGGSGPRPRRTSGGRPPSTSSAQAFELEYGSLPPSGSSSTNGRVAPGVRPPALTVLVALVRGHDHDRAHRRRLQAHRLEHVDRAHHVDRVGERRIAQRAPDHRLGREVQHDLRARLRAAPRARASASRTSTACSCHVRAHVGERVQRRPRRRRRRQAGDARAERLQPQRQPRALEARVAGDQHAPSSPEVRVDRHGRERIF